VVLNDASRTVMRLPRLPDTPPPPPPAGANPPESPPVPPQAGAPGARDVSVQPGRVVMKRRSDGSEDVRVEVSASAKATTRCRGCLAGRRSRCR